MSGRVPKERMDYSDFTDAVDSLVDTLPHDYQGVVSINRGGLPLGVELSHSLQLPHGLVSAHSYDNHEQSDLTWHGTLLDPMPEGAKVLLVDDIVDTGETMKAADAMVAEAGLEVETAALHVKPGRSFHPNFYVTETPNWVVYPWEVESEP